MSSSTISCNSYLSELGRGIVFNSPDNPRYVTLPNGSSIDRLKIERFSLGDSSVNYNLAETLSSGEMPDISGDSETSIKGTKGRTLQFLIAPNDSNLIPSSVNTVVYQTTTPNIVFDMGMALTQIPTVVTNQLITYINGASISDGIYTTFPKNYGSIQSQNGELIIVLQAPTTTSNGYRLHIYDVGTGSVNYNKMTFQFEMSPPLQPVVVTSTTTQSVQNVSTTHVISTVNNVPPTSR